jgi:hypothetical protein
LQKVVKLEMVDFQSLPSRACEPVNFALSLIAAFPIPCICPLGGYATSPTALPT